MMPKLFTFLAIENTLDAVTASSICNKGIQMYFANYFTPGNAELPWATTFMWAGTPQS